MIVWHIVALAAATVAPVVTRVERQETDLRPLPTVIHGRAVATGDGGWQRQWPGTYFETGFSGASAFFRVGPGDVSLRVSIDGGDPVALVKPAPGLYRVGGLAAGPHRLRVDVVSESQGGVSSFGGFYATAGTTATPLRTRTRLIEFVGDSHTVGYGNTSLTRQCTQDQIWGTTDTARGIAGITARRYDADYRVNAISGRGVVRNYGGGPGDTLPQAYPFALFDKSQAADDMQRQPQVIVIALGTNDFSTPLKLGEKWKTRAALRADYETSYVRFVQGLKARNPRAYVLLWAIESGDREVKDEVAKVADMLHRAGDARVGVVQVGGLDFSACDYHPSLSDDAKIAAALTTFVDAHPEVWKAPQQSSQPATIKEEER